MEGQRLGNVEVPAAADHQKMRIGSHGAPERGAEILQKNNVAIDVTAEIEAREFLRPGKHVIDAHGAIGGLQRERLMLYAQVARDLSRAWVIAEKDNLYIGMKKRPAFQRIALNDFEMPAKGLGGSEDGEHFRLRSKLPPQAGEAAPVRGASQSIRGRLANRDRAAD
jgi:hypothetical protein